jgi:hypothetical protein
MNNLKRLHGNASIEDLSFLKDIPSIMERISHNKPTTQRNYMITICSVLKHFPEYADMYKEYYEILMKKNAELKNNTEKSETQQENWMTQNEVLSVYSNLSNYVRSILKKKSLEKKEYECLLDWMILSLYVLIPPRRILDYLLMIILPNKKIEMNSEYNYLDMKNKKFIFNNYKTKGTYHSVSIDIPDELFSVIKSYLKFHPHKKSITKEPYYLLVNYYGENLSQPNMITKILNKIFGKKISVSMLRNIYLSSKYSQKIDDLEIDVAMMGTSSNTALHNYIKKE